MYGSGARQTDGQPSCENITSLGSPNVSPFFPHTYVHHDSSKQHFAKKQKKRPYPGYSFCIKNHVDPWSDRPAVTHTKRGAWLACYTPVRGCVYLDAGGVFS
ncbi:unnamed protein product, partial [Ectocarpus sp. 12 AP-2014]